MHRVGRFISEVVRKLKYAKEFTDKVKPTSLTRDGEVMYELQLEKEHCDLHGNLHAGMAFDLLDLYTWTTASTLYDHDTPFVSLNLKARFLSPAKLGDVILLDSRIVHAGRRVVYAELDILDKATKRLLVQGSHIFYNLSKPTHREG
uniref:Putative paai thioester n=1 Tax=Rhipicephalus microplus TaxID=6941 RepID=A0A6M2CZM9_RHIMP